MRWKILATGIAVTVGAAAIWAVPALAGTELVKNGTFDSATTSWWNSANTTMGVDAGRLKVTTTGGTANPWDAMIGQNGIPLTSGKKYTLSFDAAASAAVTTVTTVQLANAPYTNTLTQSLALTPTAKRFSFPFTASLSTTAGQVSFQLGKNAGFTFWVDNVSLTDDGAGPTPTPTARPGNPIDMTSGFYVDPNSNPAEWVRNNGGDARAPRIRDALSSKPMARWFGNWSGDISAAVGGFVGAADTADKLPVLVAYNIPGRDCGGHSGGGAGSPAAYRTWISAFAAAIGSRPALVVIEPDALPQLDCLPNDAERQIRTDMIKYAAEQLAAKAPNTWAYLDAGTSSWKPADVMAQRMTAAGLASVHGFSINVSNYYTTAQSADFGNKVNSYLSTKKAFVVDTSRNGNGSNGEWCNPTGRKLGVTAQVGGGAEMLLWVKVPGDSDGNCGHSPGVPAGQFSPDIAIRLIEGR